MSKLYGRITESARKTNATARAHRAISVDAATWGTRIETRIAQREDGSWNVTVTSHNLRTGAVTVLIGGVLDAENDLYVTEKTGKKVVKDLAKAQAARKRKLQAESKRENKKIAEALSKVRLVVAQQQEVIARGISASVQNAIAEQKAQQPTA